MLIEAEYSPITKLGPDPLHMKKHKRLLSLILVLGVVTLTVTGASLWILYQAALDQQGRWLQGIVNDQVALIESLIDHANSHQKNLNKQDLINQAINQYVSAKRENRQVINTLELVLGYKKDGAIHYLVSHMEAADIRQPPSIDINAEIKTPMHYALTGDSGILEGIDYQGKRVLASYGFYEKFKIGLVAKVEIDAVNAPFLQSLRFAGGLAILFITIGVYFINRINNRIVDELSEQVAERTKALQHELDERKKAQDSLKRSEDKHLRIMENLGSGHLVYVHNNQGIFTYLSPSLTDMLGYEQDEFKAHYAKHFTDNPINLIAEKHKLDSLKGIEQPKYEIELAHKDGSLRRLEITEVPVFDNHGQVTAIEGIAQDVTERRKYEDALKSAHDELEQRVHARTLHLNHEIAQRKAMEKALRVSEERFKDIARSTSNWFYEMDADLRFTYISDQFFNITGVEPAQVIGKTRKEILTEQNIIDGKGMWERHFDDLENHRPFQNLEYAIRDSKGQVTYIQIGGIPVFGEFGEFMGYRGAGNDITERKLTEANLRAAIENAEKADRVKTDFLSQMSHELRTPLNAIIGISELLYEEAEEQESSGDLEPLSRINKAGKHLLRLINDILDLSRFEAGNLDLKKEDFDLYLLVQNIAASWQTKAFENGNAIEVASSELGAPITSDMARLRQVLSNLVSNACKFTEKGKIKIAISQTTLEGAPAYQIDIIDQGMGISETLIQDISNLFNHPHGAMMHRQGGSGLGLAVADRLSRALGGKIRAANNKGQGATFSLSIPVKFDTTKPENQAS